MQPPYDYIVRSSSFPKGFKGSYFSSILRLFDKADNNFSLCLMPSPKLEQLKNIASRHFQAAIYPNFSVSLVGKSIDADVNDVKAG